MRLAAVQFALTLAAGFAGFRLHPDSYTYARGGLFPSPVGGLVGLVGGMPLLIVVSAIAAAGCVWLIPSVRGRVLFIGAGGVWLLFPGVDSLGVLLVALYRRGLLRGRWWLPLTLPTHAVAALCGLPLLWRSRRAASTAVAIALVIALAFLADHLFRDLPGSVAAHGLYLSRYLLVGIWLAGAQLEVGRTSSGAWLARTRGRFFSPAPSSGVREQVA